MDCRKASGKGRNQEMQTIWAHEKETACETEFDSMAAAVTLYAKWPSPKGFQDATNAVAIYRAKVTGEMATEVDKLNRMIVRTSSGYENILIQLDAIIERKRKANG